MDTCSPNAGRRPSNGIWLRALPNDKRALVYRWQKWLSKIPFGSFILFSILKLHSHSMETLPFLKRIRGRVLMTPQKLSGDAIKLTSRRTIIDRDVMNLAPLLCLGQIADFFPGYLN